MAWAERNGTFWRGVYRDPTGHRRSKSGFLHKSAAEDWAVEQEERQRRGTARDPHAGRIKLADWVKVWQPTRVVEPTSAAADASRIRAIVEEFGEVPLDELGPLMIQSWANRLGKDRAAATVAKYVRLLSVMLSTAVTYRRIDDNPCRYVKLPPAAPSREVFLTREQGWQLIAALDGPHATVAHLLLFAGLRWGEAAGLHVNRLHLDPGGESWLTVAEVLAEPSGRPRYLKSYPKGRQQRRVTMPGHLVVALRAHLDEWPPVVCGFPHPHGRACPGLLFTMPAGRRTGEALSRHQWPRDVFRPALKRAGLPAETRVHDLRHTYGSWLAQAGRPMREIQVLMGHKSVTTTERYAHWQPGGHDLAREALERLGRPLHAEGDA